MAGTTTTGLPVPTLGDDPNVPRDMLNLGTGLDLVTVPFFLSTTARDAAYTAATFGLCLVGADRESATLYRRRSGQWYVISDDAALDSGWVAITVPSGFTGTAAATRRIGDVVYMRGTIRQNSGPYAAGGVLAGTIATSTHYPARTMRMISAGNASSNPNFNTGIIAAAGPINVYGNGTAPPDTVYLDGVSYMAT